jgi:hypothetical protein
LGQAVTVNASVATPALYAQFSTVRQVWKIPKKKKKIAYI